MSVNLKTPLIYSYYSCVWQYY